MLEALAEAIRDRQTEVMRIFETGFQAQNDWCTYIQDSFGARPDVASLLTTATNWGDKNASLKSFQALFVASWICYPVEKGSYMIYLPGNQNIVNGHSTLDKRWSSHVSTKNARSAGEGFRFLQGYRELLVQIEGDYLFLKAEGHPANDMKHISSYFTKLKTGAGNTASVALNNLVRQLNGLGIVPRAAENYGKAYEALLKKLRLPGKEIDVRAAVNKMIEKCRKDDLTRFRDLLAQQPDLQPDITDTERFTNRMIGCLLTKVIIPFAKGLSDKSKFGKKVQKAEVDLKGIADKLLEDELMWGFERAPRLFQELRLHTDIMNIGLQAFLDVLNGVNPS
jgi:hypothetical protein